MSWFVRIYDWSARHKVHGIAIVAVLVALCVFSVSRLTFEEDITAFLPIDAKHREALQIYQDVASADKIVVKLSGERPEVLAASAARYGELLEESDSAGWIDNYYPTIDFEQIEQVMAFVYEHLPYFLEREDYCRIDSLWGETYQQQSLEQVRNQLSSMAGSFIMPVLQNDPLNFGETIGKRLQTFQPQTHYCQINGYLFSPDSSACYLPYRTPFGSSETAGNGQLIDCLTSIGDSLINDPAFADIQVRLIGAPVVAVGNARQIRHDTIIALSISSVLILLLLLGAFRSFKALINIVLATSFGFLFGLAGVSLFHAGISLIVIGISSVIMGIAVNYPLHMSCEGGGRQALSELVRPLLIGNITTVGAFLTLTPLKAVALRDLGMFSALMLVGTILWVLLVQPHLWADRRSLSLPARFPLPEINKHLGNRFLVPILLLITLVLGFFSLKTSFDSDISHLNYMTDEQRADMLSMQQMQGDKTGVEVYLSGTVTDLEQAAPTIEQLEQQGMLLSVRNPIWFAPSDAVQRQHLAMWQDFWKDHDYLAFLSESRRQGFSDEAFEPFRLLVEEEHPILFYEDFAPLTQSILTGYVSPDHYVARMTVADAAAAELVEAALPGAFDLASLNQKVINTLTDDFNYIGFACGLIVFIFLWLSFRRIELALVAFAPMVVGWLWILGMMHLLDIQFNIVNIILATFIFGQGDDYTIFITESIIRRYKEGRPAGNTEMVSILLSAAIMLLGIGVLVLAKHPAMHSLAEVTIIGMIVVVTMAWLIPPLLFNWFIKYDASLRRYLERNN